MGNLGLWQDVRAENRVISTVFIGKDELTNEKQSQVRVGKRGQQGRGSNGGLQMFV